MMVVLVSLETTSTIKVASGARGEERKEKIRKARKGAELLHCEICLIKPFPAQRLLSAFTSIWETHGALKESFAQKHCCKLTPFHTAAYQRHVKSADVLPSSKA